MGIPKNIENNEANFHPQDENGRLVDQKLDELVTLLYANEAEHEKGIQLKTAIKQVIRDAEIADKNYDKNEFSILLSSPQSYGREIKSYLYGESVSKFVLITLSIIMIILGLGMIVIPAPPFFEMFTIFYFNKDDGITVMDLISLIIILAGVYFLIKGIYKNPSLKKFINK